jgi:hypothetical protein
LHEKIPTIVLLAGPSLAPLIGQETAHPVCPDANAPGLVVRLRGRLPRMDQFRTGWGMTRA